MISILDWIRYGNYGYTDEIVLIPVLEFRYLYPLQRPKMIWYSQVHTNCQNRYEISKIGFL